MVRVVDRTEDRACEGSPIVARWRPYFLGFATALLVVRPFYPSEPPSLGESLPWVMLWLLLATGWEVVKFWGNRGEFRSSGFGGDWLDGCFLGLTIWFAVSGIAAAIGGSPRPAINATWEWIGIAVCFLGFRQWLKTPAECRALVAVMLAVAAALAIHGLYQFFWEFPATRAAFRAQSDELLRNAGLWFEQGSRERVLLQKRLQSTEPLATFALANSLAGVLVTWWVVGLGLLISEAFPAVKSRPLASADIRGAKAAMAWSRRWLEPIQKGAWRLILGAVIIVIVSTLILTKSRSAYLAALVGGGILGLWALWGRRTRRKMPENSEDSGQAGRKGLLRRLVVIGLVALGLMGLVAFFARIRAVDWYVVTEARKSLEYRFQYWQSTWGMIRAYPLLGCGPGNFQNCYTAFMLPEASEEVADPHNFFLEIWATCGLPGAIAFAGVWLAFFSHILRGWRAGFDTWGRNGPETPVAPADARRRDPPAAGGVNHAPKGRSQSTLSKGGAAAAPWKPHDEGSTSEAGKFTVIFWGALLGIAASWPLGLLSVVPPGWVVLAAAGVCAVGLWWGLRPWITGGKLPAFVPAVAVIALLIHLSAAGGISFANVATSLWVLAAITLALHRHNPQGIHEATDARGAGVEEIGGSGRRNSNPPRAAEKTAVYARIVGGAKILGLGLLCAACYWTGYRPVLLSRAKLAEASASRTEPVDLGKLEEAAAIDPWASGPWVMMAGAALERWRCGEPGAEARFRKATDAFLRRMPNSSRAWELVGDWWWRVFQELGQPNFASQAVGSFAQAVKLFPTNGHLRAKYARALRAIGQEAQGQEEARVALWLDQRTPHADRKLPKELSRELCEWVGGGESAP